MDEPCELAHLLTESCLSERTVAAFYWTFWDQILCTIKKTDQQTDRYRGWWEIEITRSTSTLQGMNNLTLSVTLPFLSPHPIDFSFRLSADEWPFRSYLLWNTQSPSEKRSWHDDISFLILWFLPLSFLMNGFISFKKKIFFFLQQRIWIRTIHLRYIRKNII